jgi:hypothetical protein
MRSVHRIPSPGGFGLRTSFLGEKPRWPQLTLIAKNFAFQSLSGRSLNGGWPDMAKFYLRT